MLLFVYPGTLLALLAAIDTLSSCPPVSSGPFLQSCSPARHSLPVAARGYCVQGAGSGICCCWILWSCCWPIPPCCLGPSEWKPCPQTYWVGPIVVCKLAKSAVHYLLHVTDKDVKQAASQDTTPVIILQAHYSVRANNEPPNPSCCPSIQTVMT